MELEKRFIIAPDDPGRDAMDGMLEAKVLKVFDGDGFLADVREPGRDQWTNRVSFRFAFIDAPEMKQPLGGESKVFLHRLITGKTLRLETIGKESTGYMPFDPYRRMLCMAYLTEEMQPGGINYILNGRCNDGVVKTARAVTRNVELEMILNGWAWVIQQYAFDREEDYFVAQEDARQARRGLWATDDPEPPWGYKKREKLRRSAAERHANLFSEICQVDGCDGHLTEREGAHGLFLGCSNFPHCRFSRSI